MACDEHQLTICKLDRVRLVARKINILTMTDLPLANQWVLNPRGSERPDPGRHGGGRRSHPGRAADVAAGCASRGLGDGDVAPRAPEGGEARSRVLPRTGGAADGGVTAGWRAYVGEAGTVAGPGSGSLRRTGTSTSTSA